MSTMSSSRISLRPVITSEAAATLGRSAEQAGLAAGVPICVAITDPYGHLLYLQRMDEAPTLTVTLADGKAKTAASFRMATHVWNQVVESEPAASPLGSRQDIVAIGGGYPIAADGKLIGAIGVSGGTAIEDQQIAKKALESAGFEFADRIR